MTTRERMHTPDLTQDCAYGYAVCATCDQVVSLEQFVRGGGCPGPKEVLLPCQSCGHMVTVLSTVADMLRRIGALCPTCLEDEARALFPDYVPLP